MTKAGFTATREHGHTVSAFCLGAHHRDSAVIGTCDGCGWPVAKTESGRLLDMSYSRNGARQIACWSDSHKCDPEVAAAHAAVHAEKIASGQILKGATVAVVKGRKIPVGTTGVVIWVGEDSWGKARVGFKDESGETFWTAASNVEVAA